MRGCCWQEAKWVPFHVFLVLSMYNNLCIFFPELWHARRIRLCLSLFHVLGRLRTWLSFAWVLSSEGIHGKMVIKQSNSRLCGWAPKLTMEVILKLFQSSDEETAANSSRPSRANSKNQKPAGRKTRKNWRNFWMGGLGIGIGDWRAGALFIEAATTKLVSVAQMLGLAIWLRLAEF